MFAFACAPVEEAVDAAPEAKSTQNVTRLAAAPNPPRIGADGPSGLADAARVARAAPARIRDARGLRFLEVSALPYLSRAPEGAAFLARRGPRALARGAPAESCPAAGVSAIGAATVEAAARGALSACLSRLAARGADAACGCRLLALDDALLAPQSAFTFATSVSALIIPATGAPQSLIAESAPGPEGGEAVTFRTPGGARATAALQGEEAELRFSDAPDTVYRGRREPFGYRRGRLAERLVLAAPEGETLTVLIGVERRDAAPAR